MTTIVFRDGIMAADSRAYSGNPSPIGNKRKIHRLPDGSLVGVSTTEPGISEAFVQWMRDGGDPAVIERLGEKLKLQALLVQPDGSVFYYSDNIIPSGPLTGPYFAIGSGDQYALGALTCGATAEAAVIVASHHDAWTGGEVTVLPLHEDQDAAQTEEVVEIIPVELEKPGKDRKSRKSRKRAA